MKNSLVVSLAIFGLLQIAGLSAANAADSALTPPVQGDSVRVLVGPQQSPLMNHSVNDSEREKKEIALNSQLEILKEKNQMLSDFQNTLISTVLWALGITVSVVLLLVGASFITNFKVHEKDIKRLSDDYESKVKVVKADLESRFEKVTREAAEAHEIRSQQDLDRQLDQISGLRLQLDSVRDSVSSNQADQLKQLMEVDKSVAELRSKLRHVTSAFRRAETKVWELKKMPTNELITALQGLQEALDAESEWEIEDFFNTVKRTANKYYVEGADIMTTFCKNYGLRTADRFADSNPEMSAELRAIFEACEVIDDK